jgi:hypothetical protein
VHFTFTEVFSLLTQWYFRQSFCNWRHVLWWFLCLTLSLSPSAEAFLVIKTGLWEELRSIKGDTWWAFQDPVFLSSGLDLKLSLSYWVFLWVLWRHPYTRVPSAISWTQLMPSQIGYLIVQLLISSLFLGIILLISFQEVFFLGRLSISRFTCSVPIFNPKENLNPGHFQHGHLSSLHF